VFESRATSFHFRSQYLMTSAAAFKSEALCWMPTGWRKYGDQDSNTLLTKQVTCASVTLL
jgi:hypothetical protein